MTESMRFMDLKSESTGGDSMEGADAIDGLVV